jgi:organic hydroperoxide reductase OsmC/OhrA
MHSYAAQVHWTRDGQPFVDNRYSRRHEWRFDGGAVVAGSSSPLSVRVPYSDPSAVDPEEAFVASLSSCHMLWFLSLAAAKGFCVESYTDQAEGVMENDAAGRMAMTVVTLRPDVAFSGERIPTADEHAALHHQAHEACYIANSVRAEVRCKPVMRSHGLQQAAWPAASADSGG